MKAREGRRGGALRRERDVQGGNEAARGGRGTPRVGDRLRGWKGGVGGAGGGFRPAHVDLHPQAYVRSLGGFLDANENREGIANDGFAIFVSGFEMLSSV